MTTAHIEEYDSRMNGYQLLMSITRDTKLFRRSFISISCQLLFNTILFWILVRNFHRALCIAIRSPRKLASWCCIAMTLPGMLSFLGTVSFGTEYALSCRVLSWCVIGSIAISMAASNAIMFERAYIIYQFNRWLLLIGITTIVVPIPIILVLTYTRSVIKITADLGCYVEQHFYAYLVYICSGLLTSSLYSLPFFVALYRRYKIRREIRWRRFLQDGAITMLLIAVSSLACFLLTIINTNGKYNNIVYIIDWIITSTLLVEHNYRVSTQVFISISRKGAMVQLKVDRDLIESIEETELGQLQSHTYSSCRMNRNLLENTRSLASYDA
ncbi:hypothetical protein BDF22DRAFT_669437 [Syncephalis plumigaleata]|nr:hypothetical protein BDF22DRAFT_669437 [Syncephalis plumigaleata]